MPGMRLDSIATPSDQEIAAALAAVRCYIEQPADTPPPVRPAWCAAAALEAQGLPAARNGDHSAWGTADRAARGSRWSYGIVGI